MSSNMPVKVLQVLHRGLTTGDVDEIRILSDQRTLWRTPSRCPMWGSHVEEAVSAPRSAAASSATLRAARLADRVDSEPPRPTTLGRSPIPDQPR
jgi:hypothetical protein